MTKPLPSLLPLSAMLLTCFSTLSLANDKHTQDFFELSIEELLQVETKVAGFSAESIVSAPSVVTVFTQQDLQSYAVNNVYDLMNFVPGFQTVTGEFISGHKKMQSRGVYLDSGYVLVMVDGIRVNEVSFGKAGVYTPYIDLALAERVEIIRGPGSAMYGSNAFLGVINVITKKANQLQLEMGDDHHGRFIASMTGKVASGDLAVNLAVVEGRGQPYQIDMANDIGPTSTRSPYAHQQLGIQWQKDGVELQYRADHHNLDDFVNLEGYHPWNQFESQNQYLMAGYRVEISDKTSLTSRIEYADHQVESAGFILGGDIPPQSYDFINGPYWSTDRLTANLDLAHRFSQTIDSEFGLQWQSEDHYNAGVVTSHLTPDGQSAIPIDSFYLDQLQNLSDFGDFASLEQEVESRALYGQVKWQASQAGTLHLGARYEDYLDAGSAFSPRIAYVQKLNAASQIKAIYSEAFRAPVTNELYSNDGVTLGNPALEPELVKTTEIQYFYQDNLWSMEVTGFYTELSRLIVSKKIDASGRTQFINDGKETISGIESLFNVSVSENVRARLTATHFLTDTVEASYDNFATFGLFYQGPNWQASVNGIWRPNVEITEGLRISGTNQTFEESEHVLLNARVNYKTGRHLAWQFSVENLTDENYRAYEPRQNKNQFGVPQLGRQLRVGVSYQF